MPKVGTLGSYHLPIHLLSRQKPAIISYPCPRPVGLYLFTPHCHVNEALAGAELNTQADSMTVPRTLELNQTRANEKGLSKTQRSSQRKAQWGERAEHEGGAAWTVGDVLRPGTRATQVRAWAGSAASQSGGPGKRPPIRWASPSATFPSWG